LVKVRAATDLRRLAAAFLPGLVPGDQHHPTLAPAQGWAEKSTVLLFSSSPEAEDGTARLCFGGSTSERPPLAASGRETFTSIEAMP
jgi:hypothetical protein